MLKRIFDLVFSILLIILLSPLLIIISIFIKSGSKGGIIFRQVRVGKGNRDFAIYKFRTMLVNSEVHGQLTVGKDDSRITRQGKFLRRYKLDELPQLFNVLAGNMSFVGPRPEVRKYVKMYSAEQMKVLSVKPGITEYASVKFAGENEILAHAPDAEKEYVEKIMPAKLALNLRYVEERSFLTDLKIIAATLIRIAKSPL